MFELSLVELAIIALVALLVLGPEKLPRAARTVGLYARKARQSWYGIKADIERELAADDLKRSMQGHAEAAKRSARALQRELTGPIDSGDTLDAGDARGVAASSAAATPTATAPLPAAPAGGGDAGSRGSGPDDAGREPGGTPRDR